MIYLDNSATTKPTMSVISAMTHSMQEGYFNPSSLYAPALQAEKKMTACRRTIDERLGGGGKVVFTSGGTEADNLGILGVLPPGKKGRVLYTAGEHPAVLEACKAAANMGYELVEVPLVADGRVDLDALQAMMTTNTRLICAMHVNNEVGALQPLEEIAGLRNLLCPDALLHVDGVQAFLRHTLSAAGLGIDSYALSAHKVHGPKGIGALWVGPRVRLLPRALGGGQEGGLRSGTENTPGIAGLLAAIEGYPKQHSMKHHKLRLLETLTAAIPALHVNGPAPAGPHASDHILNLSFPPVRAQTMLHALEDEGVIVGNGSACASRRGKVSHVLTAMKASRAQMDSAIRFSFEPFSSEKDIDTAADAVIRCYERLKPFIRR